jgi:LDH2 family malate/lactate/ureidoglycolate dehydrogenase
MIGPDFKTPRKLGHFLIAMKIDAFISKKDFFRGIQLYMNDLKKQKSKGKNKKIIYPGEIEKITKKYRLKHGIPFDRELKDSFLFIAEKYNLKFNL